jgi:E1A-binding protein p400
VSKVFQYSPEMLTKYFVSSQELMRSFNRDRRIFCALLSTHSRATGINLVEADTVVFYDNDLNPVMDAKAQEWCDRIGRCKDIHIYR